VTRFETMAPFDSALRTIEDHWAVATIEPEDRVSVVAFAEAALVRLLAGDAWPPGTVPMHLAPLAGAYEFATRQWIDPDLRGHPRNTLSGEESSERWSHLEQGASRSFVLYAALPLPDDKSGALLQALLLSALAQVGGRQAEFRRWLSATNLLDGTADESGQQWDTVLLIRVIKLWTIVLRHGSSQGLRDAMEIIAAIREERIDRGEALLDSIDEEERFRMRFYLFALYHMTEAATELLMYQLRGTPDAGSLLRSVHARLALAREATAGDYRLHPALEWLYEAATRVVEQRSAQLDLLDD
jgi:hypothetical protein